MEPKNLRLSKRADLSNFILDHESLAKECKDKFTENNDVNFIADLINGNLNKYSENYVAYQNGVLAARHSNKKILAYEAMNYYGCSSLDFYLIPKNKEGKVNLEEAWNIKDILNKFKLSF
jgi:hypothetical protein